MLIFNRIGGAVEQLVGELALSFEWRQKSRMRASIESGAQAGQAVGFDLPRGTVLRDGELISTGSGESLRIRAAAEELLHVSAEGPTALARIAYHLGNRHVPVQVGEGWLRLQYDHVLEGMVRGLGGRIDLVDDSFDPESGAYGHGRHAHSHAQGHGHGHAHSHESTQAASLDAAGGSVAVSGKHVDARHAPRIHDFLPEAPSA